MHGEELKMFFRRPRITKSPKVSSIELLQDALAQYGVAISIDEGSRELQSLRMDDIDLVEAIQLIEVFVDARVDRKMLRPSTTLEQVARAIDETRRQNRH